MAQERMTAEARTAQLIAAGYKIAKAKGIAKVTRAAVARETKVSDGLLNRYFGTREGLRTAVMQHAADQRDAATLAAAAMVYELDEITMTKALRVEVARLRIGWTRN